MIFTALLLTHINVQSNKILIAQFGCAVLWNWAWSRDVLYMYSTRLHLMIYLTLNLTLVLYLTLVFTACIARSPDCWVPPAFNLVQQYSMISYSLQCKSNLRTWAPQRIILTVKLHLKLSKTNLFWYNQTSLRPI